MVAAGGKKFHHFRSTQVANKLTAEQRTGNNHDIEVLLFADGSLPGQRHSSALPKQSGPGFAPSASCRLMKHKIAQRCKLKRCPTSRFVKV